LRACGANWAAIDHRLAISGIARRCREQHIGVMVWTVNHEREMRYWLFRRRIDILITDRPALAVAIRDRTGRTVVSPSGPPPRSGGRIIRGRSSCRLARNGYRETGTGRRQLTDAMPELAPVAPKPEAWT
jgi:hypothetical protein